MGRTKDLGGRCFAERRLLDLTAANTGRADANALAGPVDNGMDGLQIQIPAALGDVMGMTDTMPELRTATADFTNFSHKNTPWPKMTGRVKHQCTKLSLIFW